MPSLRVWAVVALAGVAATGGYAHAESAEAQVERLASEAVAAYRGADYNRAIELLARAYEIRQVPAILYNLAKAYDRLGDVEHAYDAYRRYADSADADPKLKAKADARLTVLEESRRKKAAAQRAVEPKQQQQQQQSAQQQAGQQRSAQRQAGQQQTGRQQAEQQQAAQPAQLEPTQPQPPTADEIKEQLRQERQEERRRDRYVALGLGVGALAFAGVAVGLSVNALSLQSQWSSDYGGDEATRRSLKDSAITRAAIADGFYAATAVAVGVGAYFLYRGFRPEPTAPSLALLPAAGPAGAALVAVGRF